MREEHTPWLTFSIAVASAALEMLAPDAGTEK
jgi:hypothetical protein